MNDPQNPLSQLLIELGRIFAVVPQTSEDDRNSYIMALVEMARFVREAARSTQNMELWNASWRLTELACALDDLGKGRVATVLRRTKHKGSPPDNSVMWIKRVRVLTALNALQKSGLKQGAAATHIDKKYPGLRRLMTRGKDLPSTIMRWRRELEEAKKGTFLAQFSEQMMDAENILAQEEELSPDGWRQFADNMLAGIQP
jgi:hypothetical protein